MKALRSIIPLVVLIVATAACASGPKPGVYSGDHGRITMRVTISLARTGNWAVVGTYTSSESVFKIGGTIRKSGAFLGTVTKDGREGKISGYWNEYQGGLTVDISGTQWQLEPASRTETHSHGNLAGTWECRENGEEIAKVSGNSSSLSVSIDWKGNSSQTGNQEAELHADRQGGMIGKSHGTYKDQDKTVTWTGSVEMTFSGESFTLKTTYKSREFSWNAGVTPYENDSNVARPKTSVTHTFTRKK